MQKVQAAAREIDKATSQAADIHSTPKQSETHIVIDQPMFKLGGFLMAGSMGVFGFIGESTMVLILVFFLLLSGDTFKRKLVRLTGPSLSDKKITVHIGIFIITWMTDKIGKMNAVTIFVVLLFYGWLT
jgi:predicted PurR-regulated permease PerM